MKITDRISSEISFIFVLAGAAIGLGNIWRFPYIAAENGGSLFFIAYIIFVFLLGAPIMICEIIIGKIGRSSPANCIKSIATSADKSVYWSKLSWLGLMGSTLILSFYATISGMIIYYFANSIFADFTMTNLATSEVVFQNLQQSPLKLISLDAFFIAFTFFINSKKASSGIEKLNHLMMPLMYTLLFILVVYASKLAGFNRALEYLFAVKFEVISKNMLIEAMGHALFTLAAGACCLMSYGAYMPKGQSVIKSITIVIIMDILVAILVGITTFAIVFTENMPVNSGPGLMFLSLPVALNNMPMGNVVQAVFFFLLLAAASTSAVNLAEPLIMNLQKKLVISRQKAAVFAAVIVFLLSLIPCLSFNIWNELKPIFNKSIFELYTGLATEILLPVTGLLILLFTSKAISAQKLANQLLLPVPLAEKLKFIIKYISPLIIILLLLNSIFY